MGSDDEMKHGWVQEAKGVVSTDGNRRLQRGPGAPVVRLWAAVRRSGPRVARDSNRLKSCVAEMLGE